MTRTIALVQCVKTKHNEQMPAGELFCSIWFYKASAYAQQVANEWLILSAKYGLVDPGTVIAPYDVKLSRKRKAERRTWARKVMNELDKILQKGDRVILLAGVAYREYLIEPIRAMGCTVEIPMAGLDRGKQLKWLKENLW